MMTVTGYFFLTTQQTMEDTELQLKNSLLPCSLKHFIEWTKSAWHEIKLGVIMISRLHWLGISGYDLDI